MVGNEGKKNYLEQEYGDEEQLGSASHRVGPGKRTRVYYRARGCDTVNTTAQMKATPVPYTATAASKAAAPSAPTSWTGWVRKVFSFPVMCMFLLASVIFGYAPRGIGIGESDIWWHLLNARNLLQYHSLSRIDTRSFTVAGSPWMSFEWLSEIPFFLAFKTMGLQGVIAVYSTVMVLIFAGVYYRACRGGADCKNAALATLAGICIGSVSLAPRTLLFGWLCMTGLLLVLDQFKRAGKGLWLLPPLFALWINLHGSWLFGIVVLVTTIASGLVEGEWGLVIARRWFPVELKKLLLALCASLAALFVNPFGHKLVLYPFDYIFRQQGVIQGSEYWRSVDFSTWNGKLALILILVLMAAALFSRSRRWRLDEVLLTAFALWCALSHVRFLDFAALIIVPILAPRLDLFPPYEPELDKPWLNAAIMAAVLGSVIFFFPSAAKLQQRMDHEYPGAALAFMQRQHINGRIFNSVEFGGYLEWNAPELKPFIDGRGDIFIHNGIFDDYCDAVGIGQPFAVLDKYRIDYVLVERTWPLVYLLEHSTAWRSIYSDKVAVLFERKTRTTTTTNTIESRPEVTSK